MACSDRSTKRKPRTAHQDVAPRVAAGGRKKSRRQTLPVGVNQRERWLSEPATAPSRSEALLKRLLDGWADWLNAGLVALASVRDATSDYRRAADPLDRFLMKCVAPDPDGRVQSSTLHALFSAWAKASGAPGQSNKDLSIALKTRGFRAIKSDVIYWLGIKLVRSVDEFGHDESKLHSGDATQAASRARSRRQ
jgi:hypothetical protein